MRRLSEPFACSFGAAVAAFLLVRAIDVRPVGWHELTSLLKRVGPGQVTLGTRARSGEACAGAHAERQLPAVLILRLRMHECMRCAVGLCYLLVTLPGSMTLLL